MAVGIAFLVAVSSHAGIMETGSPVDASALGSTEPVNMGLLGTERRQTKPAGFDVDASLSIEADRGVGGILQKEDASNGADSLDVMSLSADRENSPSASPMMAKSEFVPAAMVLDPVAESSAASGKKTAGGIGSEILVVTLVILVTGGFLLARRLVAAAPLRAR